MKKYAVDEIINNIAILENIDTKEKLEISINLLPNNLIDGDILIEENNVFKKDDNLKKNRIDIIREKMEKLKNNSNN